MFIPCELKKDWSNIVMNHSLTVHFVQDELISGQVQFSQVKVSDVSISFLEKNKDIAISEKNL